MKSYRGHDSININKYSVKMLQFEKGRNVFKISQFFFKIMYIFLNPAMILYFCHEKNFV